MPARKPPPPNEKPQPGQSPSPEWRLVVDELGTSVRLGHLPTIHCRIRVTTPDQDPTLVTLRMEVQLKDRPPMPDDEFAAWLGRLAADRLRRLPPLPKLPDET
jgi:hypothetical protein